MSLSRRQRLFIVGFISLILAYFGLGNRQVSAPNGLIDQVLTLFEASPTPLPPDYALVSKVIDGDTVELEGGRRVRYIGINTPEINYQTGKNDCYAAEAKQKNQELVESKVVRLEKDISETDKFGRLLRYVYVDDLFVNKVLVEQGFAQVSTFPPDVKYQKDFVDADRRARESSLGLWGPVCPPKVE